MTFRNWEGVEERLRDPTPLARDEIRELFPYIRTLGEGPLRYLWTHLTLLTMQAFDENRKAIKEFDDSSKKLTTRLLWLTWSLVALTVVIAIFTVLLWWRI